MLKKLLFLVTLAAMLTACLPAAQPTADVQGQVNTAVAGTIQANEQIDLAVAQTVAAGEAAVSEESANISEVVLQATNTPEPTFTPFVVASPTATPIPLKYTCSVFKKKPRDNENFNRNEKFDVKFVVTNTGTRPWPKGIDFKFVGGTDLASPNRVEIPRALVPGETYEVVLDGQAPDKKGFYVMTYFVDGPMCYGYIAINVK
jgi:hypothetical protein